ncbi:hypothetical protein P4689_15595 [Priestia megaterium]|uniref:hypothetical protein n=1 Tax=Priestia megaterium TaxID=1404 RepID=UPI002E2441BC|nr:hypothetical protein [Priestia megaterium]
MNVLYCLNPKRNSPEASVDDYYQRIKEGLVVVEQGGTSFFQNNEAVQEVVEKIQRIGTAIKSLVKDTFEV